MTFQSDFCSILQIQQNKFLNRFHSPRAELRLCLYPSYTNLADTEQSTVIIRAGQGISSRAFTELAEAFFRFSFSQTTVKSVLS